MKKLRFKKPKWFTWHLLPSLNEISIKSIVEILVYLIIFGFLVFFYIKINTIKDQGFSIFVEKIDDNHDPIVLDTILMHSAYIEIKNPLGEKNLYPTVTTSFDVKHSILMKNAEKNDSSFNSYFGALQYVNRHFSKEINLEDTFALLNAYINDRHFNVNAFSNIASQINGSLTLADDFFGDDPIFKVLENKAFAFNNHYTDSLRSIYDNAIKSYLADVNISNNLRYPLYYYELCFTKDKARKKESDTMYKLFGVNNNSDQISFEQLNNGNINDIACLVYYIGSRRDNKFYLRTWKSGKAQQAPKKINKNEIPLQDSYFSQFIDNPSIFSLYDISHCKYHFDIKSTSIDSLYLIIDFVSPCQFSSMSPSPDEITPSSIIFHDQWKISKIKKNGIDFIVQPYYNKNLQSIRLFVIQALISALLLIFFMFIINVILKRIVKSRLNK